MPEFDPFGGGAGPKPKKSVNLNPAIVKKIKTIVILLIIIGVLYFIINQIFFNFIDVNVNIENTEGDPLTQGSITFRRSGQTDAERFSLNDNIKLKKGVYSYVIMVPEYKLHTSENKNIKDSPYYISESVEKNINLSIDDFRFVDGDNFFPGQNIQAEITLKNTSANDAYYLKENVDFVGDAKDWEHYYITTLGEKIENQETLAISPSVTRKYFIVFEIPENEEIGEKTIYPKINYLKIPETFKTNINILDTPEIKVSCINTKEKYVFGEETKNIVCEIDNSKNQLIINDLTISLDLSSDEPKNENVDDWFRYTNEEVLVSSSSKKQEVIELRMPTDNVYPTKITGEIIFESRYFVDDIKTMDLELTFEEPEISFEIDLSNDNVSIEYDVSTNDSEMKYTTLELNNKNNFRINVLDVNVLSPGLIEDCENLIYYDLSIATGNILQRQVNNVPITITVLESTLLDTSKDITRQCSVKVFVENPFREDDVLEYVKHLTITTEIIRPPEPEE